MGVDPGFAKQMQALERYEKRSSKFLRSSAERVPSRNHYDIATGSALSSFIVNLNKYNQSTTLLYHAHEAFLPGHRTITLKSINLLKGALGVEKQVMLCICFVQEQDNLFLQIVEDS